MSELQGGRVILRTLDVADAARLKELRPTGWGSGDDWPFENSAATRYSILFDGSIVGFIQFSDITEPRYRHATLDIFVGEPWHNQGVCTDAVRTLAVHLVRDLAGWSSTRVALRATR